VADNLSNICQGTSGTAISTANSTGPYQFDAVTASGTGSTSTWDNTHVYQGGTSWKISCAISVATIIHADWTTQISPTPVANAFARCYVYMTAYPTVIPRLINFLGGASVAQMSVRVSTTGTIQIVNELNNIIATSTGVIPLNAWCRVEGDITANSGTTANLAARIFSGANLETGNPDSGGSISAAAQTTTALVNAARYGPSASVTETAAWNIWFAGIAFSDTAAPGPSLVLPVLISGGRPAAPPGSAPQVITGPASSLAAGTASAAGAGAATAVATVIAPAAAAAAGLVTDVVTQIAPAASAGAGSVTAAGSSSGAATAAAAGAGAVTDVVTQIAPATAAGAGSVTAAGTVIAGATAAAAGAVTGVVTQAAAAAAAGAGATAAASAQPPVALPVMAASDLPVMLVRTPSPQVITGPAAVTAQGTATAAAAAAAAAVATQIAPAAGAGAAAVTATGSGSGTATAAIAGAGAVTAVATQAAKAAAAGAGSVAVSGVILGTASAAGAGSATAKAVQSAGAAAAAGASALAALAVQQATAALAAAGQATASGTVTVAFTVGTLTSATAATSTLTAAVAAGAASGGVLTATDQRTGGPS